jgi:RNA polymerase sigma-70 factor (ECF subfamily)
MASEAPLQTDEMYAGRRSGSKTGGKDIMVARYSSARARPTASLPADDVLGSAFRENAAKLYSFIYAKVGNREAAEDLTSQVFLKAARWLGDDHSAASIRGWLYTTARSTIVDYWREQSHYQRVPLDEVDAVLFCGPAMPAEVPRTRARALRLLAALPERDREVLRLRFLHGYTAREIGEALGLTVANVRVLQMRALRRAAQLAAQDTPSPAPNCRAALRTRGAPAGCRD